MKWLLQAAVLAATLLPGTAGAAESASILMYHRFGEDRYPSTNIRLEQFESHIRELSDGDYWVLSLADVVAALRANKALPDMAVALTIDDAALSVYEEAWPRLRDAGMPFTLFVSTDIIDQGARGYMSWDQIREMARAGVAIGAHGAAHASHALLSPEAGRRDLEKAVRRLREELGQEPDLLAWPYGETNAGMLEVAEAMGFDAAFGQHSGVAHPSQNAFYFPRFPLNESYGEIERFRLVARAKALPVRAFSPADPLLAANPPTVSFQVDDSVRGLAALNCFANHVGAVQTGIDGRSVAITIPEPFPRGQRGRLNCTLPADNGRWRWLGYQWLVP